MYGNRKVVNTLKDKTIGSVDCEILQCHQYNYLGVMLDECLSMKANFNNIFKKFSNEIYQFGKIHKYYRHKYPCSPIQTDHTSAG